MKLREFYECEMKKLEEVDFLIANDEGSFGYAYFHPHDERGKYCAELFRRPVLFENLNLEIEDDLDFWDTLNDSSIGYWEYSDTVVGAAQMISDYWNAKQVITEDFPVHVFSSLKEAILYFKRNYAGKFPAGTLFAVAY